MKKDEKWKLGTIVNIKNDNGYSYTVLVDDEEIKIESPEAPLLQNPSHLDGTDDLVLLSHLHEPAVLFNLEYRYSQQNIYTFSGIVLIAINPYQDVPLYEPEIIESYKIGHGNEPHLFSVIEKALTNLEFQNQSIVISGESGAGKTESAKHIMRYCSGTHSDVEERVLSTNPILEAFGNAQTTRNDNSSRFGKYIEILFEGKKVIGANIKTFLLEKSRVCYQAPNERNYHVFYLVMNGLEHAERKEFNMDYEFKYAPNTINSKEKDQFKQLQNSLSCVGVSLTFQWSMFRVIASILHLGNSQLSLDCEHLTHACELLEISKQDFLQWLTHKELRTGNETILKDLKIEESISNRDAISKHLYSSLFEWLITAINDSISASADSKIGVLDIYGFEYFKQNSFEQFCINFANEKLQQEFTRHVFKLEQDLYVEEGIEWSFINFQDNQPCISLIEGKYGIIDLLDEECRFPNGSDKSFTLKLLDRHQNSNYLIKPRFGDDSFTIKHFAKEVCYNSSNFLEKNKDSVSLNLLSVLKSSRNEFTRNLFQTKDSKTLGSEFKKSLNNLMLTLNSTECHYIRCIKPNHEKQAFKFDQQFIQAQLLSCGILETIKISCSGYPNKFRFDDFVERFYLITDSKNWKLDLFQQVTCILQDTELEYQIGKSMVFFRSGQIAYLEQRRTDKLTKVAIILQKHFKRLIARRAFQRARVAVLILQRSFRVHSARKLVQNLRRNKASTVISTNWKRYRERNQFKQKKAAVLMIQQHYRLYKSNKEAIQRHRNFAATKIQSRWKSKCLRNEFKRTLRIVVNLQTLFRCRLARMELKKLKIEAKSVNHFKDVSFNLEKKVVGLTQQLDVLSIENSNLTKNVETLMNENSRLESENRRLKEQIVDLKQTERNLVDKIKFVKQEKRDNEKETLAKSASDEKVKRSLSMSHSVDASLATKVKVMQEEFDQLAQENQKNIELISMLKKEMDAMRMKIVKKPFEETTSVLDVHRMRTDSTASQRVMTRSILKNVDLHHEIDLLLGTKPFISHESSEMLYPGTLIGVLCHNYWKYGMVSELISIIRLVTSKRFDFFWLGNIVKLFQSLKESKDSMERPRLTNQDIDYDNAELNMTKLISEVDYWIQNNVNGWFEETRKSLLGLSISAILDYQGLPGYTISSFSMFTITIDQMLDMLSEIQARLSLTVPELSHWIMKSLLRSVHVNCFNSLMFRKTNWKRAMQIQYNLTRIEEWCSSNNQFFPFRPMVQAVKLLQLDIKDFSVLNAFTMLNSSQVRKLVQSAPKSVLKQIQDLDRKEPLTFKEDKFRFDFTIELNAKMFIPDIKIPLIKQLL